MSRKKKKKKEEKISKGEVEINFTKFCVELSPFMDAIAQLDEAHMNSVGRIFCGGFTNMMLAGYLGATPAQVKTLAPKLAKLGKALAELADLYEQEQKQKQPINPPLPGVLVPGTSKAQ